MLYFNEVFALSEILKMAAEPNFARKKKLKNLYILIITLIDDIIPLG